MTKEKEVLLIWDFSLFKGYETMATYKKKTYTVEGCTYRTQALADFHKELRVHPYVQSFSLPTVGHEKGLKNSRFKSYKVLINDLIFDSAMEAKFYLYLLELKDKKEIRSFERQVTFELQPGFTDAHTNKKVRPITYIADFVVTYKSWTKYVIDVKGVETAEFKLKKKMFQYKNPDKPFMCLQLYKPTGQWLELDEIKKLKKKKRG